MKGIQAIPANIVEESLARAFSEDWGLRGDISSYACIGPDVQVHAQLRLRSDSFGKELVVAGLGLAAGAFRYLGRSAEEPLQVEFLKQDGDVLVGGSVLAQIYGSAQALLSRERVALNYLCHMSGIATLTRQYVKAVAHTKVQIVDTRKTTPGLRALEKFAVRCAGGKNHRFGLFDAMIIKDNHVAACGGILPALQAAHSAAGHMLRIELEIDTLQQLYEIDFEQKELRPDCVLLDNMSLEEMRTAVEYVAGRAYCEASGGVNLSSVASIAECGVDFISVGALTHSAAILDIGLDIQLQ